MRLETAFICEREHLVIDTSGVPDAQDVNASIYQFLRDAVYGGITLGANDHLILPVKGLVNGFHQVVVFPVPGGPCTIDTCFAPNTLFTASS